MVTGGESWNALVNGSYDYIDNDIVNFLFSKLDNYLNKFYNDFQQDDLSYFNQNSFGFIDGYYVDMHVGIIIFY